MLTASLPRCQWSMRVQSASATESAIALASFRTQFQVGPGVAAATAGGRRPPVSRMMEGNLILRIQPDYPSLARQVRVQGQVVLRAMISREGTIENLQVLSGHPMLVRAAVDAVRRWRYRPYVLNGEPVEVETEVTVNFVLSGG